MKYFSKRAVKQELQDMPMRSTFTMYGVYIQRSASGGYCVEGKEEVGLDTALVQIEKFATDPVRKLIYAACHARNKS
jgi:hypothetical protein